MDAYKESGGIEFAADFAGVLWTDAKETDQADGLNRAVTLFVLKNRNGELANIKTTFKADKATFDEVSKEDRSYTDSLKGEEQ
jgi:replicative DNA helicase